MNPLDTQGYYPVKHVAPPLVEGKRPHMNDYQPAVYDKQAGIWRAWYLWNEDIDTEGGTAWREIVSLDLKTWTDNGVKIPKYTNEAGDVWTGSCFIDETNAFGYGTNAWLYFVTQPYTVNGNQNQSVSLWVAQTGSEMPVYKGMNLANPKGNNYHFRDPSVRMFNGIVEMVISIDGGVAIYNWNGKSWTQIQCIDLPYATIECPQRLTIHSKSYGQQEILLFSGNVYAITEECNTACSMFLLGTMCGTQFNPSSVSQDVTRMLVDNGTDCYGFRGFLDADKNFYGVGWISNWDYDAGLPTNDFMGMLTIVRQLELRPCETGYPVLAPTFVVPDWKRHYENDLMWWTGDYSNIPFKQVPSVCSIELNINWVEGNKYPDKFEVMIGQGGYASCKLTICPDGDGSGNKLPYIEVTRDSFGLRPFGALSSWNYYPRKTMNAGMSAFNIQIMLDNNSITWVVNGNHTFTQLVYFPEGCCSLWVHMPQGTAANGTSKIYFDEYPEKPNGSLSALEAMGHFMDITIPVITTFTGKVDEVTNPDGTVIPATENLAVKQFTHNTDGGLVEIYEDENGKWISNPISSQQKIVVDTSQKIKALQNQLGADEKLIDNNRVAIEILKKEIEIKPEEIVIEASGASFVDTTQYKTMAITPADVKAFCDQSSQVKARGLRYAGKYSLTPVNCTGDANGNLISQPYGTPPDNGELTGSEEKPVPVITDACYMLKDPNTGIYYLWFQYQHSSQSYPGHHWMLDGPAVSVSNDRLNWSTLVTEMYAFRNHNAFTVFWLDRENKLGHGYNVMWIGSSDNTYALKNWLVDEYTDLGYSVAPYGDGRLYWDWITNGFLSITVYNSNSVLQFRTSSDTKNWDVKYTMNDPIFQNVRVECPDMRTMKDTDNGQLFQVLTVAIQPQKGGQPAETACLGTFRWDGNSMTSINDLRQIEWGYFAYANILGDPDQNDGTGGTPVYCDKAYMQVGCYNWAYINGNWKVPIYGFCGGAWIPAEVVLSNYLALCLPNTDFKNAMTGAVYTMGNGTSTNTGWQMYTPIKKDVWRLSIDVNYCIFTSSTLRLHFGDTNYVDYVFAQDGIDCIRDHSGKTVIFNNDPKSEYYLNRDAYRKMPLVTADDPTISGKEAFVIEYDHGRIRLYNTKLGIYQSNLIFPDGEQLSSVEIIGNDMFTSGFQVTVNQDNGGTY